ncbi:MAG: glycosyltransferase family 39 protein [Anaerolineales bacterium]|nr:glycosyltransferase family 39 protein [Anaerolineales bacterium]
MAARTQAAFWLTVAGLLAATLLRAGPLRDNRFHPDEALYAYFGRLIASDRDPLLASEVVDKPPLPLYLQALSLSILGGREVAANELAARLPNFFADSVNVALLCALARRLYGPKTATLAAWLYALSPFAILFAVTVFIDPLLTAFVMWGLWMSAANRLRRAALALALALATKQTALLFLPLALALSLSPSLPNSPAQALKRLLHNFLPFAIALGLTALLLFGWDTLRLSLGAPIGFWAQGYADNAPNRLIRSGEVLPRAFAWLDLLSYFTASPLLNITFAVGLPVLLVISFRRRSLPTLFDLITTFYLLIYLSAYWLLAFNVWDRYLVPVLPLALLLLARTLECLTELLQHFIGQRALHWLPYPTFYFLLPTSFFLLLLSSALTATRSGYPIGGDHGAYDGIDDVARYLNTLPEGTVLYDFWLSWQWRFYLFDGPAYVAWMPTPEALETDLRAFGRTSPRYLVAPSWESIAETQAAVAQAGFTLRPVYEAHRRDGSRSFVVYRVEGR